MSYTYGEQRKSEKGAYVHVFSDKEFRQHNNLYNEEYVVELKKPLEDEIKELKEHISALKSSHDLSHQAYLFAKNEGLELQKQAEELINNQNRKQWQDLAVKEFADKLFDKIDNNCIVAFNSRNQESFIYPEEPMMAFSNFRHHLNQLLKERGIE